jgi:hypothetical protein
MTLLQDLVKANTPKLTNFAVPGYVPPTKTYRFNDLRVLAFDQALQHTGVVDVVFHGPNIEVIIHKTLTLDRDLAGNAAVLEAGAAYFSAIREEIVAHFVPGYGNPDIIIFEQPPVPFKMFRPESAMMAGLCIKLVCRMGNFPCDMVQAQRAKTVWAANPKASKAQLKRGILEKFPYLKGQMGKATEHEWDALALALTFALGEVSDGSPAHDEKLR